MYKNIGKKIKGLTKAYFYICSFLVFIAGLLIFLGAVLGLIFHLLPNTSSFFESISNFLFGDPYAMMLVFQFVPMGFDIFLGVIGLLTMLLGPLLIAISTWFIYGYGEMIDKISDIERNTRGGSPLDQKTKYSKDNRITIEELRDCGLITEKEYKQYTHNR